MTAASADVTRRARAIRLLVLDVDGVLTDGRLYYSDQGAELKAFNIQDGLGIKLLQRNGIAVGIITGRTSPLVARRAAELGISLLIQGREDKFAALAEALATLPYRLDETAFMGDDLPDLGAIRRVGLGMAVANANAAIAACAHWQSALPGGAGAVREAAEFLLNAQGKLATAVASYH